MPLIVCERRFDEPLAEGDLDALARRLGPCLERTGARHLVSLVSPDGRSTICQFEAPDAEAVRLANRLAGAPFERVWAARRWPEAP